MPSVLLLLIFALLLPQAAADQVRPSSGETVLAFQTYTLQWNISNPVTNGDPVEAIVFEMPNTTPPSYMEKFSVDSRKSGL